MAADSKNEQEPWQNDTFSCFDDYGLCVLTFCLPCYTIGQNADALGEDGLTVGLLYGIGCLAVGPVLRWRIRQKQNLMGNMIADVLLHALCPCCALIQENKQLYEKTGEKKPLSQDMLRQ